MVYIMFSCYLWITIAPLIMTRLNFSKGFVFCLTVSTHPCHLALTSSRDKCDFVQIKRFCNARDFLHGLHQPLGCNFVVNCCTCDIIKIHCCKKLGRDNCGLCANQKILQCSGLSSWSPPTTWLQFRCQLLHL
jgi:hypothetical protein